MKKWFVIHPILFALFPILFLFSHNIKEMSFRETIRPIVVAVSFALLLWLVLVLLIKSLHKAGIVTSIFLLFLFSYGHLTDWLFEIFDYLDLVEDCFVVLCILPLIAIAWAVIRSQRKLVALGNYLNIVAIILVVIPVITIALHRRFLNMGGAAKTRAVPARVGKSKEYPDIYYIILDSYARADILKEFYHYDNSEFLKYLAEEGFYIANKSRCNYAETDLSLASSLNLAYLEDLARQMGLASYDKVPLQKVIWNSRVVELLKEHGYLIVAFSSGDITTEVKVSADIFKSPRWSLNEFENLLLGTTPIPVILDLLPDKSQFDLHRDRLLYIFDHLADGAELDAPVFVFAHIMAPHPPFVFGKNGEKVKPGRKFVLTDRSDHLDQDEYIENYRNQLIFVNKKIKAAINEILSSSSETPIIILQGDHGPISKGADDINPDSVNLKEKMCILNAYYLPDGGHKKLYEDITPVNTFRVVFNHYFDTNLGLLEDKSYFYEGGRPFSYKLIEVTDRVNAD
ncbi:MAG: hypothetical protein AMS15_04145 [Planctomycetes bacterium DG_23]|nr:MAG: hypothetical protein AMS15_04145 [Planctomycetes bacterium DG_23]